MAERLERALLPRQLAYEHGQPMTKLVRQAIDRAYGTVDDVLPQGRPPVEGHKS
jgi:hypothetical protein